MNFRYINTRNIYPYDRHLIDGLKEGGHQVSEIAENSPGTRKYLKVAQILLNDKNSYKATFVGYPTPIFAIIIGLICRLKGQKSIFNAVYSHYEANVVSRGVKKYSLAGLKWWLVDFFSFHLSWRVLLESNAQKEYVQKLVKIRPKKLVRSWSGVDEKDFFLVPGIKKAEKFTVVFRGRFLAESGIETVIRAAHLLESTGIVFRIIGAGFMYREVNALMSELRPKNIEMINETLSFEKLREKMLECHVSLGQLADHQRLERTLPCKLFESLALGLPYLTGRNQGVLELLTENENCACVEPGDARDLADKILFLKDNPEILAKLAQNGHELYKRSLTSKHLAQEVLNNLNL